MCPGCLASAAVMVAGVVWSGGLAALVAKALGVKGKQKLERTNIEKEK
ncbi:MAG: hypothetical protein M3P45_03445 [Acidobacteriota bacterium]|nr:hypothetical protein [Acidobacteriota bacterium]